MNENNGYQHLERRPGSNYKQLFVKGIRIRAEVLYRETLGEDARTPEEVAKDFHLPLEVVQEAIDYCIKNPLVLRQDLERETESAREYEAKFRPLVPPDYVPDR